MPKTKQKTIKAWAIINKKGDLIKLALTKTYCVYYIKRQPEWALGFNEKIVPCEIKLLQ